MNRQDIIEYINSLDLKGFKYESDEIISEHYDLSSRVIFLLDDSLYSFVELEEIEFRLNQFLNKTDWILVYTLYIDNNEWIFDIFKRGV